MVTADGRVKVLDFGLAKLRDPQDGTASRHETASLWELTGEGRIVGTAAYMSPEQAEGRPLDHRTDLFSLGILLYEMATGERPFRGESVVSVLSSILRDVPRPLAELNPRLPREFTRIVRRCLAKDPDERYQSAKDLRLDLEDLRQELGSSEQSRAAAEGEGHRAASIRRWAAVAGLVVLAGSIGTAAWLSWRAAGTAGRTGRPQPRRAPDGRARRRIRARRVARRPVDRATAARRQVEPHIYLQAVGGERPLDLAGDAAPSSGQAAFSPDGTRIAFRSSRAGGGLFVMGRTGELVRQVSDTGFWPAWSPDAHPPRLQLGTDRRRAVRLRAAGPRCGSSTSPPAAGRGSPTTTARSHRGRRTTTGSRSGASTRRRRTATSGRCRSAAARRCGSPTTRRSTRRRCGRATDTTCSSRARRGGTTNLWRVAIDERTGAAPRRARAGDRAGAERRASGALARWPAARLPWRRRVPATSTRCRSTSSAGSPSGLPRWILGGPHHWGNLRRPRPTDGGWPASAPATGVI